MYNLIKMKSAALPFLDYMSFTQLLRGVYEYINTFKPIPRSKSKMAPLAQQQQHDEVEKT